MKQSLTGFDWTESDGIEHLYWHTTRGMYNLFWVASMVTPSYTLWAKTAVMQRVIVTLSKQTKFICPQMLILCGLMQKMPMRLRRRWAYTMPAVMAAGSAGGTVMVMMSRDSMMMVLAGTWGRQKGKRSAAFSIITFDNLWLIPL